MLPYAPLGVHPIQIFNPDLQNSPQKIGVWWVARLKISISLENFKILNFFNLWALRDYAKFPRVGSSKCHILAAIRCRVLGSVKQTLHFVGSTFPRSTLSTAKPCNITTAALSSSRGENPSSHSVTNSFWCLPLIYCLEDLPLIETLCGSNNWDRAAQKDWRKETIWDYLYAMLRDSCFPCAFFLAACACVTWNRSQVVVLGDKIESEI